MAWRNGTCHRLLEAVRRDPTIDVRDVLQHPRTLVTISAWADEDLVVDWTLYYGGREDCAAAAVLSYRHGRCTVLTTEPDAYAVAGDRPHWVTSIDDSW